MKFDYFFDFFLKWLCALLSMFLTKILVLISVPTNNIIFAERLKTAGNFRCCSF